MNEMLLFLNRILSSYNFYRTALVVLVLAVLAVCSVLLLIFSDNDRMPKMTYDDLMPKSTYISANVITSDVIAL